MSGPLDKDLRDPSRWGPMGTHVSHGAFHELFFHTMEFRLSRSLSRTFLSHNGIAAITEPFMNFSFARWNFGYHGAFHEFFFHTMEFQLSRSLSWTFLSPYGISGITGPFHGIIPSLWDFGHHEAFSWNHSFTLGFQPSRGPFMESYTSFGNSQNIRIGGNSFHKW
jgi:hypothetical protein